MSDTNASSPMREKILTVTRQLFVEKGVHDTSLADIAVQAEISRGTLFYYYKSKNELVYDIIVRHFQGITSSFLQRLEEMPADFSAQQTLQQMLDLLIHDSDIARLNLYLLEQSINEQGQHFHPMVREKYQEWIQLLVEFIARLGGEKNDQTGAVILLAAIDGLLVQSLLTPELLNLDELAGRLMRLITRPV